MTVEDMKSFYTLAVEISHDVQGLLGRVQQLEDKLRVSKAGECVACNCTKEEQKNG